MRKIILFSNALGLTAILFLYACKKDAGSNTNGNGNTAKSKTELLTSAAWKFDNAKLGGTDISGFIDDCDKDNIATFVPDGTGIADEGPAKCNTADPQTIVFNWSFQNNESAIHTSSAIFSGNGDFKINSLTETRFIVSRDTVLPGTSLATTFAITMKH